MCFFWYTGNFYFFNDMFAQLWIFVRAINVIPYICIHDITKIRECLYSHFNVRSIVKIATNFLRITALAFDAIN